MNRKKFILFLSFIILFSFNLISANFFTVYNFKKSNKVLMRFAVIADNRPVKRFGKQPDIFKVFIDMINHSESEFVVMIGDFIFGYSNDYDKVKNAFYNFKSIIDNLNITYYLVPGNHDIWNKEAYNIYKKIFGKTSYYFKKKGYGFIILNSELDNITDNKYFFPDEYNFLKKTLSALSKEKGIFLFLHRPLWFRYGREKYGENYKWEMKITPLLKRYPIKAIFAGHEHRYVKSLKVYNTQYFITGGAGAPIRVSKERGGFYHFLLIDIYKDGTIKYYVVKDNGRIYTDTLTPLIK